MFSKSFMLRLALAVVSGVIYALAYPPVGQRWVVFLALVILLIALKGVSGTRARVIGFLHGLVAFGVGLSWLLNLFGSAAVGLWAILAFFPMAFAHFQGRAVVRGLSGWRFAVFTALNWGAWEFVRAEIFPLKFPWMTVGLAVGPNLLTPWVGVYCAGLLVVLAAVFLVQKRRVGAAVSLGVVLLAVGLSKKHEVPSDEDGRAVRVAGIQLEGVSLNEYLAATRDLPEGIQHVVWPEGAIPYNVRENERDWGILQELCREKGITLTFGTQARPGGGDEWRNIAVTMDASGYLGEHTKVNTVHFFDDGTPGGDFRVVETEYGEVGTPICFDADYENVVRKMATAGAEYFVVPTMDAESWSARQHDQHAELARMRAAENGRWMFAVATSGVSQLIDPNGQVHERLGAMEQGTISGVMRTEEGVTFYTNFGWVLPWVVLVVTGLGWIYLIFSIRRDKRS